MRLALYYPWIYLTGGAERSILELTRHSRHRWTIFTSHYEPENTFPDFAGLQVIELEKVSVNRDISFVARAGWTIIRQRLPLDEFDALLIVCDGLGDLLVFRNHSKPVCCCCLSPLRVAFDPVYRAHSSISRGATRSLLHRAGIGAFRTLDRLAWKHYRHTFFISQEAARRAVTGGLVDERKVDLVHPGTSFRSSEPSLDFQPFFLIAGRIMWTKNIELGIQAFQQFKESFPDLQNFRLTVAGIVDQKSKWYYAQLRALAGNSEIEFVEAPSDTLLVDLYRSCYGLIFTPLNEDWGMVPIEAMSFGKPVLAVNRGGPTETILDGLTGYLLDPTPEAFAEKMGELAHNRRLACEMGSVGFVRAKAFSWANFARHIDDKLEEVADVTPRELKKVVSASAT